MNIISRYSGGKHREGYTILIVVFAVTILTIGLLVAIPVWETQIQREKEEELIFRGLQYVEAVRLFQKKNPGRFPENLEELLDEKCIRQLFPDPMTESGEWHVILPFGPDEEARRRGNSRRGREISGQRQSPQAGLQNERSSPDKILVAPLSALDSLPNPQIIGVVSSSTEYSKKIYHNQDSYDKWLFFYGMDPENMPEVEYLGESDDE
ncbi:MAG: hypothetical protein R6V02_02330 [Candidatus Aminicenantes bacterium]